MKQKFKKMIPKCVLNVLIDLHNRYFGGYATKSYAQEGEDMILRRVFEGQSSGFYVDVGAPHPMRFSNTYFFYKRGWRGINIDAMPGSMKLFQKIRPEDTNLEIPIAAENKVLTYHIFNEPALNGFDPQLSAAREAQPNRYKVIKTVDLRTKRLDQVLDEHLPENRTIDFLSIDVEGLDFDVLQSNNWEKYRPNVILVEILASSLAELESNKVSLFLKKEGYEIYAKAMNTVIFRKILH